MKPIASRLKNCLLRSPVTGLLITITCLMPPHHQAHSQAKEASTVNLNKIDILSLIDTVSKKTGKNFIVDPRVKANVTVISSDGIPSDKLYELFLSVLDVHGFAAVPAGSMIKIVPLATGVQSAVPVSDEHLLPDDELITEIIHVRNISAQKVVETLRPLVPAGASLSAEPNSNTVVITDRAANIARLLEIITELDNSK